MTKNDIITKCKVLLGGMEITVSDMDEQVLSLCCDMAYDRAQREIGGVPGENCLDILVRMTLGEYFFYLEGSCRATTINEKALTGISSIKEGDVTVSYKDGATISTTDLIASLQGAIRELAAERKLTW